ncbi:hypothetical protein MUCCIDRAFT_155343 [Mucor lusitanicus CBS 277.49]|uniref:Uncharacterized protein n=1 Tax=Mucor lusitanicus CBS 277.49 TaxID=747725 RepID=A0A168NNC6_MUCCL|nr:hypothetical protein MUCCIDRAFT_156309 [Mucor lusitanicus CBS 277.49]OAD06516.1 hypothetical protein MUCCIDRAFT_155343 [Mucor lusitanicus CBS 277.49]
MHSCFLSGDGVSLWWSLSLSLSFLSLHHTLWRTTALQYLTFDADVYGYSSTRRMLRT